MNKKEKNKKPYAQKLVPIIVIAIITYTIASFLLQWFQGVEISATLTTAYFSFFAVELVNLAAIKVKKNKNEVISSEDVVDNDMSD